MSDRRERTPRWVVVALVGATLIVGWPLLLPVVYDTHDGHYALYNAAQFDVALRDGQLPVRWLPDLFGGRGLPHFVFYHPLAFYLGSVFHVTGLGFIASMKIVHLLALALSGFAMFRWLRDPLGPDAAAVGAVAYLLAPYRAVEVHVKGDPPAALAFVFLPFVLLAIRRAARGEPAGAVLLALSSAGLVLSHSVTALVALPALALYAALQLTSPKVNAALRVVAGVALGAVLSAFYWLPAIAEKSLVHVDSRLGILFFDFREHFVVAWQWLSPLWGYHGSFAGPRDDMSFQIGPLHALGLVAGIVAWRRLCFDETRRLAGWAAIVSAGALFVTLSVSRPVWEWIGPLRFVQFPWRFLSVVVLTSSVLLAVAVSRFAARGLLAWAASIPAAVTLVFALASWNRWYLLVGVSYAVAGAAVWLIHRAGGHAPERVAPLICLMLGLVAVPWTAVPLHAALRGEPVVIALAEADLSPDRVRLGVRRTTARDDYLPRTVGVIPPRDASQEYLPPPDAEPPADVAVDCARVLELDRSSDRFSLSYEAEAPCGATLNLHDYPGWRASVGAHGGHERHDLTHDHDDRGRIVLDLPEGRNVVELRFGRTAVRRLADVASLLGVVVVMVAGLFSFSRRRRK